MDTAESFEDHEPGIFDEIVEDGNQEKVVQQDVFALSKFLLCCIKIEIDVQVLDKLRDGISVGVRFLSNISSSY